MFIKTSSEIAPKLMPQITFDSKSNLVHTIAIRKQEIIWAYADPHLCCQIVTPDHNELIKSCAAQYNMQQKSIKRGHNSNFQN